VGSAFAGTRVVMRTVVPALLTIVLPPSLTKVIPGAILVMMDSVSGTMTMPVDPGPSG